MSPPEYRRAYRLGRAGERDVEVWVRWPWQRRWFSEVAFTPTLRVLATPRGSSFDHGVVALEVLAFDAGIGIEHEQDAGWRTVDVQATEDEWKQDRRRRFKFTIPPTLLDGEGTYQCRLEFHEREPVDEAVHATVTRSCYHVPIPFRLQGAPTAVPLVAAGVAAFSAVASVIAAVVSTLAG